MRETFPPKTRLRKMMRSAGNIEDSPFSFSFSFDVAVCQNLVPLVNIKIAGKWMFIPLKMVLIGIDPYPCVKKWSNFHRNEAC